LKLQDDAHMICDYLVDVEDMIARELNARAKRDEAGKSDGGDRQEEGDSCSPQE